MKQKLKKSKWVFIVILIALLFLQVVVWVKGQPQEELLYTQEYLPGSGNIKGNVEKEKWDSLGESFEIGANADGYAVFKNPKKAMDAICRDYRVGIKAMRKEGAPWGLFRLHYKAYPNYFHVSSKDPEVQRQVNIIAGFVDIYENSFEPITEE